MSVSTHHRFVTYGPRFDEEQNLRNKSEQFVIFTLIFSLIQIALTLISEDFDLPYSQHLINISIIVIFLSAVLSTIYEFKAENTSQEADYGRRVHYYLDLFSDDFRNKEMGILENKGFEIDKSKFENDYSNKVIGVTDQTNLLQKKIYRFYTILFKVEKSRNLYKNTVEKKYYGLWGSIGFLVLVTLGLHISNLTKMVYSIITLIVLSPFALSTLSTALNWQSKTDQINAFRLRLLEPINEYDLGFLFLEYSILLQRVIKIPNYKEMEPEILEALQKDIKNKYQEFTELGIFPILEG